MHYKFSFNLGHCTPRNGKYSGAGETRGRKREKENNNNNYKRAEQKKTVDWDERKRATHALQNVNGTDIFNLIITEKFIFNNNSAQKILDVNTWILITSLLYTSFF